MEHVRDEIADVFIYLVRLADKLNVDIEKAVLEKIELNESKASGSTYCLYRRWMGPLSRTPDDSAGFAALR